MPASSPEGLRFNGLVYRALNPIWARKPLSGEGARLHGGRFNPKGMPALYTALDILTAIREASQVGQPLQPTTLVSYTADFGAVLDGTDPEFLAAHGATPEMLAADDWRLTMQREGRSAAQDFSQRMAEAGFVGMIVPSFARFAPLDGKNLVLWQWDERSLTLNDADGRLQRDPF